MTTIDESTVLTLEHIPLEWLDERLDEWPHDAQRDARARLADLAAGRDDVSVRVVRRGRYLRVHDVATGLLVCLLVPTGF